MNLGRFGIWSLPIVMVSTMLSLALRTDVLAWPIAIAIVVYVIVEWPEQGAMARGVAISAVLLAVLAAAALPAPGDTLWEGLDRFAFMASFLACLGLLRTAAETSPLLRRCGQALVQQPPQRRYLTLSLGAALFGMVINIGVLNLLGLASLRGNTLAAAGGDRSVQNIRKRRMFSAILRGFALVPLISPLGISLAVILSALPGLRWLDILPFAGSTALLMLLLGWALDRMSAPRRALQPPQRKAGSLRPLLEFCLLLTAIVGSTFLFAALLQVSLPTAVLYSGPLAALVWLAAQRRRLAGGSGLVRAGATLVRRAHAIFPSMRGEIVVLGGAAFIGVLLSELLPLETLAQALTASGLSGGWLALGVTLLMLITSQFGINPIVSATLLLALLPAPEMFGMPSALFAAALMAGWSLAMVSAPITAAMLVAGRLLNVSPITVGWRWNGAFVVAMTALLAFWFPFLAHLAA